jgi:tRNA synthetases class II (A)
MLLGNQSEPLSDSSDFSLLQHGNFSKQWPKCKEGCICSDILLLLSLYLPISTFNVGVKPPTLNNMHNSHHLRVILRREYSSAAKFSASEIRKTFTNYFVKEHSHKFVPSSSVLPHNDASLAFVNAGMNQV